MGEFRVHHVRFFEYQPKAINCISHCADSRRVAVSRSDGSIEIWSLKDLWYQEKVIPGFEGKSIEAICWQNKGQRLFTAGLDGNVTEYDLLRLQPKATASSNAGPIWCMTSDASGSQLAAGTEDGCVVLFDTGQDLLEYKRAFDKQEGRILCIAWHVKGDLIVTGGIDNLRLWSVNSGHAVQRLTLGRQEKNKETIVWCVAITSDMTIISGDSRGKTIFWNGKQGTQLKSIQSHRADVFCLCVSQDETTVLSSGVDPTMVHFKLTSVQKDSDWKQWIKADTHCKHTHDVRAVVMTNDSIVSGGMDTNLVISKIVFEKGKKFWKKLAGIPHNPMVQVSREASLVTIQYSDYLEIWRLGHTNCTSDKSGDILPVQSLPHKLVQLKNKASEPIVCFATSSQGNGMAFSDQRSVKVYKLNVDCKELINPTVSLTRLKVSPSSAAVLPAHHIALSADCQCIVTAANDASVQVLMIVNEEVMVDHTFSPVKGDRAATLTHLAVDFSNGLAAVSDCENSVILYSIQQKTVICHLPKYRFQATALCFTPSGKELVIAYADQKVYEFDVENQEYSAWCKKVSDKYPIQWMKRQSKISHIAFQSQHPEKIFLQDEQMFCILNKSQDFPDKNTHIFQKSTWQEGTSHKQKHAFHTCGKYKFILHLEPLADDWLVIVERTALTVLEALPDTLKMKKFGT